MRVDGMHPWWDEEEEKRRAAAIKTRPKGSAVNTGKGSQSFDTLGDYDDAIGKLDSHIEYLNGQQYEAMMQGHQTKMNALTPMIKKAERDKAILENERSNVMGLGENGWDSKSMLEPKMYRGEPLSTDIARFTPEQQRKMDVLVGEHLPVNPNHLTPEQRSKADVYVGENSVAGQYVPSNTGGADGEQYVDDMTQTFNGMSAGLEAAQANTRESILDSLSPELRSKANIYVGKIAGESRLTPEQQSNSDGIVGNQNSSKDDATSKRIDELINNIFWYYQDQTYMKPEDFNEKYMVGSIYSPPLLDEWRKELAELTGEGYANEYVDDNYWNFKNTKPTWDYLIKNGKAQYDDYIGYKKETDSHKRTKDSSTVSYNIKGVPIEPDHNDYNLNRIMNAPLESLSKNELDQRILAETNRLWMDMQGQIENDVGVLADFLVDERNRFEKMWDPGEFASQEEMDVAAMVRHTHGLMGIKTKDDFVEYMMEQHYTIGEYTQELKTYGLEKAEKAIKMKYNKYIRDREGAEPYVIDNQSGQHINNDTMGNIVSETLNSMNGAGDPYESCLDSGSMQIVVQDYKEEELTKQQAQAKFKQELRDSNETIKSMVSILTSLSDPVGILIDIANEIVFEGNKATGDAISFTHEAICEGIDKFDELGSLKSGLKDFVLKNSLDLLLNAMNDLAYNLDDIEGGNYCEAEFFIENTPETRMKNEYIVDEKTFSVRLIEYDGVFIEDDKNPMTYAF